MCWMDTRDKDLDLPSAGARIASTTGGHLLLSKLNVSINQLELDTKM